MQTVVETDRFQRDVKLLGMSDEEHDEIVNFVAANPDAGDEIKGTGGARNCKKRES